MVRKAKHASKKAKRNSFSVCSANKQLGKKSFAALFLTERSGSSIPDREKSQKSHCYQLMAGAAYLWQVLAYDRQLLMMGACL